MEKVPIFISALALATSIFTFWWLNIREKNAFHLVRLQKWAPLQTIDFALVNGGKRDILVTSLNAYFEGPEPGSRFFPAARIHGGTKNEADLIGAGKAIELRVEFTEALSSSFAQKGAKGAPWQNLFCHKLGIELTWVDMKGKTHGALVPHSLLGLAEDGAVRGQSPISDVNASVDLFRAAKSLPRKKRWNFRRASK